MDDKVQLEKDRLHELFEQYKKRADVVLWIRQASRHAFRVWSDGFKAGRESAIREAIAAPGVAQGWVMVPKVASTAMLRPFYECPPDELALAYEAMLIVARRAAPSPTAEQPERPPYCGSGHCSCIECPYAAPVTIKGGNE